jgi:cupin superfamily acireductone dioxygenase involved in methionine salvage
MARMIETPARPAVVLGQKPAFEWTALAYFKAMRLNAEAEGWQPHWN